MAEDHGTYDGAVQYIEILAGDLSREAEFYSTVFRWNFQLGDHYAGWQDPTGNMGGGMYVADGQIASGGPRIYITVDEIDEAIPRIEQHGGVVTTKKTLIDEHTGWWAGFTDTAGNAMYLYQSAHTHPH